LHATVSLTTYSYRWEKHCHTCVVAFESALTSSSVSLIAGDSEWTVASGRSSDDMSEAGGGGGGTSEARRGSSSDADDTDDESDESEDGSGGGGGAREERERDMDMPPLGRAGSGGGDADVDAADDANNDVDGDCGEDADAGEVGNELSAAEAIDIVDVDDDAATGKRLAADADANSGRGAGGGGTAEKSIGGGGSAENRLANESDDESDDGDSGMAAADDADEGTLERTAVATSLGRGAAIRVSAARVASASAGLTIVGCASFRTATAGGLGATLPPLPLPSALASRMGRNSRLTACTVLSSASVSATITIIPSLVMEPRRGTLASGGDTGRAKTGGGGGGGSCGGDARAATRSEAFDGDDRADANACGCCCGCCC
jgi:hypothetical protein